MDECVVENPSDDAILEIRSRLRAFNIQHFDTKDRKSFIVKYVDSSNEFVGGICFEIFGRWLEIEYLFVEEKNRKKGLGSILLKRAEEIGRAHKCSIAGLDTFDFQAKPFYEKHGYTVVYEQKKYPTRGSRYYFEKDL